MNKHLIPLIFVNLVFSLIALLILLILLDYISSATEIETIIGLAIIGLLILMQLGKSFFLLKQNLQVSLIFSYLISFFSISIFLFFVIRSNITSDSSILIAIPIYTIFEAIVIRCLGRKRNRSKCVAG